MSCDCKVCLFIFFFIRFPQLQYCCSSACAFHGNAAAALDVVRSMPECFELFEGKPASWLEVRVYADSCFLCYYWYCTAYSITATQEHLDGKGHRHQRDLKIRDHYECHQQLVAAKQRSSADAATMCEACAGTERQYQVDVPISNVSGN